MVGQSDCNTTEAFEVCTSKCSSIFILTVICRYCYLLGFVHEYVTIGLELIGRCILYSCTHCEYIICRWLRAQSPLLCCVPDIPIKIEEKKRIQNNLTRIYSVIVDIVWSSVHQNPFFQSQNPFAEKDLNNEDVVNAENKWSSFFGSSPLKPFTVKLSSLASCGRLW